VKRTDSRRGKTIGALHAPYEFDRRPLEDPAMEPLNILNDLRIAAPCPASWSGMRGDDRVRFCELCSKKVYNLSGLTAAEAAKVVSEAAGSLCVRLYRRRDGTVLTADCPVGVRRALRRRLRKLATAGALAAAALWSSIRIYALGLGRLDPEPTPTDLQAILSDWGDSLAQALGLRRRARYYTGVICISSPSTTPASEPPPPAPEGPETPEDCP
jgi:hypothetical protein